jgi:hypothetical protein
LIFKKIFTASLLLFLIVPLSGCLNQSQKETGGASTTSQAETTESEESFQGSLKDLLNLGNSMKCTWQKDEQNYGVSYIKDDKFRAETTINDMKSYVIFKDNCSYSWQEGVEQGWVYCSQEEEIDVQEGEVEEEGQEAYEDAGRGWENYNYQCQKTNVDDDMFVLPEGIEFTNPLESMPSVPEMPNMEDLPSMDDIPMPE